MFPWLWLWAPHLQFPLSGNVAQDYRPSTDWLFGSVQNDVGVPRIEKRAFSEVATYGRQLGLITEVLLELGRELPESATKARESLGRLKNIQKGIEDIKQTEYEREAQELAERIKALKKQDSADVKRMLNELQRLIDD